VTKGKSQKSFFTLPEFEQWREENNGGKGWNPKYYKVRVPTAGVSARLALLNSCPFRCQLGQGLGTSTAEEAKKYFSDMGRHMLAFDTTKEGDHELIDLAFNKKKADDRKEWLRQFKVRAARSSRSALADGPRLTFPPRASSSSPERTLTTRSRR
jgi:DNA topoisomerase-2